MGTSKKLILLFLFTGGLAINAAGQVSMVKALLSSNATTLISTPLPATVQPFPSPTATIDPATIGDTSGVIRFGMIVVIIILVGVVWGYHEFRKEARNIRSPRE